MLIPVLWLAFYAIIAGALYWALRKSLLGEHPTNAAIVRFAAIAGALLAPATFGLAPPWLLMPCAVLFAVVGLVAEWGRSSGDPATGVATFSWLGVTLIIGFVEWCRKERSQNERLQRGATD